MNRLLILSLFFFFLLFVSVTNNNHGKWYFSLSPKNFSLSAFFLLKETIDREVSLKRVIQSKWSCIMMKFQFSYTQHNRANSSAICKDKRRGLFFEKEKRQKRKRKERIGSREGKSLRNKKEMNKLLGSRHLILGWTKKS